MDLPMNADEEKQKKQQETKYYNILSKFLAQDDIEAEKRYKKYYNLDPFPNIEASLLNSADIFDYVKETGMIWPFHPENLKGASYEVGVKGTVVYWDEDNHKQILELENNTDKFTLASNSIAFVTLEPIFRIPDYLALRFNLKISHVYKGLLLGTGPLVDPGFIGRLSIPLHNLTANEYIFHGNDLMISMEFTKLSTNHEWNRENFYKFHLYKRNWIKPGRDVNAYIERAAGNSAMIKSSIPDAIGKATITINQNRDEIKKQKEDIGIFEERINKEIHNRLDRANFYSFLGTMGFLGTLVALCAFGITSMNHLSNSYQQVPEHMNIIEEQNKLLEEQNKKMEDQIEELNKKIEQLEQAQEQIIKLPEDNHQIMKEN